MSTLKVPGAQLSYEVSGSGLLLILIPGARGEGEPTRSTVPGGNLRPPRFFSKLARWTSGL